MVGEVATITGDFIELKKGTISWIADSGRFMNAIDMGTLDEVEPVRVRGGININSITDYFEWEHELPRTQK